MHRSAFLLRFAFLLGVLVTPIAAGCGGCGDDENNLTEVGRGTLLVAPGSVSFGQIELGEEAIERVALRNVDDAPLTIFSLALEDDDSGSIDDLSIELTDSSDLPFTIAPGAERELVVTYAPDSVDRASGVIVIASSDPNASPDNPRRVEVRTIRSGPELEVSPRQVRFTRQPITAPATLRSFTVRNIGTAPLTLTRAPARAGSPDFTVLEPARRFPLVLEPYDQEAAAGNPELYELEVEVRYRPLTDGSDMAEAIVYSLAADGEDEETTLVPLQASSNVPCILADAIARNFGQVPVAERALDLVRLENCGSQPLNISAIRLEENSEDSEFALDLGDLDADRDGSIDATVTLAPGERAEFTISYTPSAEGGDAGIVRVSSNDPVVPELDLLLSGRGAVGVCPIAVATGRIKGEAGIGSEVVAASPLDTIVLEGAASEDPDGVIPETPENWIWEVLEKPAEAVTQLRPFTGAPNDPSQVEVEVLVAGDYRFGLRVIDNEGFTSCERAEVVVRAVPKEAILVELTWTNPLDPDETDDLGADVDLHVVKVGPGEWFRKPYDIFFDNRNDGPSSETNPIWGFESPSLDRDDTDGAGPENFQLDNPQDCSWYAVGIHNFEQLFGTSYATVRVYINQRLVFEQLNLPLTMGDQFIDVARIHWPSGDVLDVNRRYEARPSGQAPERIEAMDAPIYCEQPSPS